MKPFNCAIIGASGMVGGMFVNVLEERNLPIENLYLFASKRSAGKTLQFKGQDIVIEELKPEVFDRDIDIALFAVDGSVSHSYAQIAAAKGCIVVDNSSAWRLVDGVPLVVPEVNPEDLKEHSNIIANPNCCAAPTVVALKPLLDKYGIERVVISTYQSVSGAGINGMNDLERTQQGEPYKHFPYQIANNLIPHIDKFHDDGYTGEEKKLIAEVRKMLHKPTLAITATCVRVPIEYGHSLSINIELYNDFEIEDIRKLYENAPGIVLQDDVQKNLYPMPFVAAGTDHVYIGRIRRDDSFPNCLNLWVVADNIRKGAATNAVQIVEALLQ